MNASTEQLTDTTDTISKRWSASTTTTAGHAADLDKHTWEAPPVPPIPSEHEEPAWRRRSLKRCSYTSQMTCGQRFSYAESKKAAFDIAITCEPVSSCSPSLAPGAHSQKHTLSHHDAYAELHWQINALNPRTWSRPRKWFHTFVASWLAFMVSLASSTTLSSRHDMQWALSSSSTEERTILPSCLFVLALAFGPPINKLCSAVIGRKLIYLACIPLVVIFFIAAGFCTEGYGIMIALAAAGFSAAPVLSGGYALANDIWDPEDRDGATTFISVSTLLGAVIGAIIGPIIVERLGSRWTMFIVAISFAASMLPISMLRETSKQTIMRRKGLQVGPTSPEAPMISAIVAPVLFLVLQPVALLISCCSELGVSILYASFLAFPSVLSETYGFRTVSRSLTFGSMLVGIVLAVTALAVSERFIRRPRITRWRDAAATEAERHIITDSHVRRSSVGSGKSVFSTTTTQSKGEKQKPRASETSSEECVNTKEAESTSAAAHPDRNPYLGIAAAAYLNSLPANVSIRIEPHTIIPVFHQHAAFGDICAALEAHHLRFDHVQLAKALVDATRATEAAPAVVNDPGTRARSSSFTGSMSDDTRGGSLAQDLPPAPDASDLSVAPLDTLPRPTVAMPAPEWTLHEALPGSILSTSGLLLFAWCARPQIHWIIPCVGMALFACGTTMILVSVQSYLLARYTLDESEHAIAGIVMVRYTMSFAFVLIARRMFDELGTAWATTTLAIVSAVFGIMPLVLVMRRTTRRTR